MTAETRTAFRAFVRLHHPDVGGDPETFRVGLAAFRAADHRPEAPRGRWAGPPDDDPRLDAPVVVAPAPTLRRLGRAGRRLVRRARPRVL